MITEADAMTPAHRMFRMGEMTTTFTNQGKACSNNRDLGLANLHVA